MAWHRQKHRRRRRQHRRRWQWRWRWRRWCRRRQRRRQRTYPPESCVRSAPGGAVEGGGSPSRAAACALMVLILVQASGSPQAAALIPFASPGNLGMRRAPVATPSCCRRHALRCRHRTHPCRRLVRRWRLGSSEHRHACPDWLLAGGGRCRVVRPAALVRRGGGGGSGARCGRRVVAHCSLHEGATLAHESQIEWEA